MTRYREAPVTHFVSLIDPDEMETELHPPSSAQRRLRLAFNDLDDIEVKLPMFKRYIAPTTEHMSELVEFGRTMADLDDWGLLTHCEAGISRSTAAAITIVTAAGYPPQTAFEMVNSACPEMLPNRRMLRLADDLLNTDNRLYMLAETHRRKMFQIAGYEDPTNVRLREYETAMSKGWLSRILFHLMARPPKPQAPKSSPAIKIESTQLKKREDF